MLCVCVGGCVCVLRACIRARLLVCVGVGWGGAFLCVCVGGGVEGG